MIPHNLLTVGSWITFGIVLPIALGILANILTPALKDRIALLSLKSTRSRLEWVKFNLRQAEYLADNPVKMTAEMFVGTLRSFSSFLLAIIIPCVNYSLLHTPHWSIYIISLAKGVITGLLLNAFFYAKVALNTAVQVQFLERYREQTQKRINRLKLRLGESEEAKA